MNPEHLIEAYLLLQDCAQSEKKLRQLCSPELSSDKLMDILDALQKRWENRGLILVNTVSGWRFQVSKEAHQTLADALNESRMPRYSRAVMETLAIIAYRQPVTRGDIENIRGVSVSHNVMQTLQERGWIEIAGHRDSIGKPALWATTDAFLSDLQLKSLNDLPALTELGELMLPENELPNETKPNESFKAKSGKY